MGFTSDACWFLLTKTLLIKKINNKKREAALKNEAGVDEKHIFFFLLGLTQLRSQRRRINSVWILFSTFLSSVR